LARSLAGFDEPAAGASHRDAPAADSLLCFVISVLPAAVPD